MKDCQVATDLAETAPASPYDLATIDDQGEDTTILSTIVSLMPSHECVESQRATLDSTTPARDGRGKGRVTTTHSTSMTEYARPETVHGRHLCDFGRYGSPIA